MNVTIISKKPHTTLGLRVEYNQNTEAQAIDALTKALRLVEFERDDNEAPAMPDGTVTAHFYKDGSGIFSMWLPQELKLYERQLRNTLAKVGFTDVPHQKLTFADLI